jgi:hypothetical protein
MLNQRFRTGEQIAAEVIDGEAVIINLATGLYYSLDGAGGQVWALVDAGCDVEAAASAIADAYGITIDVARNDVVALVGELVAEGLVEPVGDGVVASAARAVRVDGGYRAPNLVVYRDMGDLLALDPPAPGLADIAWGKPKA